jgi:hypothetical protein
MAKEGLQGASSPEALANQRERLVGDGFRLDAKAVRLGVAVVAAAVTGRGAAAARGATAKGKSTAEDVIVPATVAVAAVALWAAAQAAAVLSVGLHEECRRTVELEEEGVPPLQAAGAGERLPPPCQVHVA